MKRLPPSNLPAPSTPELGMVPRSFRGSVFDRYKRREGVAAVGATLAGAVGFPVVMLTAGLLAGSAVALAVGTLELVGFAVALNWLAALGHRRFRRELVGRVPGVDGEAWFVGLGGPGMNTANAQFFTPRLDTDDNVGFLRIDSDGVGVTTEEGAFAIPRAAIRGIRTERLVSIPTQPLIRIDWDNDDGRHTIYVVSREGSSLLQHRRRTLELLARLETWHAEHVDKFLEAELGMTFSG